MLWLPKWLRDDGPPAASEGVSRRAFLFLGAAAGVGLVLPAPKAQPLRFIRVNGVEYRVTPHPGAFLQATMNEMESVIHDIQQFQVNRWVDEDARNLALYQAGPNPTLQRLARQQAARKRYLDWRANTRSDG